MNQHSEYTDAMKQYWVYIIECADGSLYTGISTDVERRFREHRAGTAARYTRSRGVKRIVYRERAGTRSAALQREATIKRFSREQKRQLCGV